MKRIDVPPMNTDEAVRRESELLTRLQVDANELDVALDRARSVASRPASTRVHAEAMALVSGDADVALEEPTVDIEALTHRARVARTAVEIQTGRVTAARSKANAKVLERIRPQYRAHLQEMVRRVAELNQFAAVEIDLRHELEAAGYSAAMLSPCPLPGFQPHEEHARINIWLREVERDHGIKVKV